MAFKATKSDLNAGLKAQAITLLFLQKFHSPHWQELRPIIEMLNPELSESEISFHEKKKGDLVNFVLETEFGQPFGMEVQCGPSPQPNVIWKKSKKDVCESRWQAFFLERTMELIVVETEVLRKALDDQRVAPTPVKGDSIYVLGPEWLKSIGGKYIMEWCDDNRVDGSSPGQTTE